MIEFKKQHYGADVATVLDNEAEVVEVMRRSDGKFELTVHNRQGESDRWRDISAVLKPEHFVELGKIAEMALCSERECVSFGKVRGWSCMCHHRFK